MDFGIASVAAITVIAYLVGAACKASSKVPDTWIPVICGVVGAVLGVAGLYLMPDFPAADIVNALAVGIPESIRSTSRRIKQIEEVILYLGSPSVNGTRAHRQRCLRAFFVALF